MELPWETILGAASGSAIVTVLGVIFAQKVLEGIVETTAKSFESALTKAEETHKKQLELAGDIDLDLRERRKNAYGEIWGKMKLLPKWPRAVGVRYEDLSKLRETFRDWYFDGGGMYLSTHARDAFGQVQDAIEEVVGEKKSGPIKPEEYEAVRAKCSAFRTAITDDLLSRRAALVS
jgi:hypothetical protein